MRTFIILALITMQISACVKVNRVGTAPAAPSDLDAVLASPTKVNLTWIDNAIGESGYKIERKIGTGTYLLMGTTAANVAQFTDSTVSANTSYTYRVYAFSSSKSTSQYSNEVIVKTSVDEPSWLNDGLVAYYPFNGNANDESGNGNNGTVNGATLTTDRFGNIGKAYNFNGSSFINLKNLPTSGNQDFSIAGWIKTNSATRNGIICWGQDKPNASVYLFINSAGNLNFDLAYYAGPASSTNIADNSWHFIGVTNNSGLIQLYLDGSSTGSAISMTPNISGSNKSIGQNITNGGPNNFIGAIDEIRIWNRVITKSEMNYLSRN